ncbi:MAG: nitroreductase [Kosmotoga sp.]|nr:MAG: nitroreductase [Kosmotoga sp.]
MSSEDRKVTGISKISSGFALRDENNNIIDCELLKGRYSIFFYVNNLDSTKSKKLLHYFDNKIDVLMKNSIELFVVVKRAPEKISQFRKSEKVSLEIFSTEKQDELAWLGIDRSEVNDNIALFYDRWRVKRGYWKSIEDKTQVIEIIESAKASVKQDKLISNAISLRRARRSIRKDKVPRKDIERLIKAAHLAPSCFNKQPWRFVAVDDGETLEKLHNYISAGNSWMNNAPVLIVVYSSKELDCELSDNRDYYLFDTGLAVGMLLVQATKMGLIAHPVAGYKPKKFKEILELPDNSVLITVIAVGYQGESSLLNEKNQKEEITGRKRNPVESIFHWYK